MDLNEKTFYFGCLSLSVTGVIFWSGAFELALNIKVVCALYLCTIGLIINEVWVYNGNWGKQVIRKYYADLKLKGPG